MRDPRIDPQVGDCLKRPRTYRWVEVIERRRDGVWIKAHWHYPSNGVTRFYTFYGWRKWAAKAVVIDA